MPGGVGFVRELVDVVGNVAQQQNDGLKFFFQVGWDEVALIGVGQRQFFQARGDRHFQPVRPPFDAGVLIVGERAIDALDRLPVIQAGAYLALDG